MDNGINNDYFVVFYNHQCCSSLRSHEILNRYNLLLIAAVMLLCECAKSVMKKNRI